MPEVTRLLNALRAGDGGASDDLIQAVYGELRRLAASKLRRERGQSLQATALVHEAWLRITSTDADGEQVLNFENRSHFLGAAAEAMRRILIERARKRRSLRHGGAHARAEIEPDELIALPESVDLIELDEALKRLAEIAPEKAQLVTLRFFGGLSIVEAADVLGVSRATADRSWAFARAWLFKELKVSTAETSDAGPEEEAHSDEHPHAAGSQELGSEAQDSSAMDSSALDSEEGTP